MVDSGKKEFGLRKIEALPICKTNLCTEFQANKKHIVPEEKELYICYSTLGRTSTVC